MNADPDLVYQLKGLKDVVLDVDFVSKTNQVAESMPNYSIKKAGRFVGIEERNRDDLKNIPN